MAEHSGSEMQAFMALSQLVNRQFEQVSRTCVPGHSLAQAPAEQLPRTNDNEMLSGWAVMQVC